ncbi:cytochrome C [Vitiosangium sp. GDMCC 1.1324]|nr:cytochrome C [Vitiosangium sp. GDMCC 1.1324]
MAGLLACSGHSSSPEASPGVAPSTVTLSPTEQLGRSLFFDRNLSEPPGQACASCHDPRAGWTGPSSTVNAHAVVYEGAVVGRFGNRKPPSAAYATQSPLFHLLDRQGSFEGGAFWDGRATGERLGNAAAGQAQGPFLNPAEQNNANAAAVVAKVCGAPYAPAFRALLGGDICDGAHVERAYDGIARAIAAYEGSREVNAFSSRYDAYLAGRASLSAQELEGLNLFEGRAKCARCHPNRPGPQGEPPLFTDYTYDNLGVPRNPESPWYTQTESNPLGAAWVDNGLGAFLATRPDFRSYARGNLGLHKVPSLRNVDKRPRPDFVKAYGHNGYFKSLESIVHFYNTRDVLPVCLPGSPNTPGTDCWPAPEVGLNVNEEELGNLGLSEAEEAALVAFLRTLSDGYLEP